MKGRAYDRDTSGQVGPKPIPAVQEISKDQAVNFIHQYHYSKVMPRLNRFYLGFFIDGRLAGVVVLGWGTQPLQTIRKLFPCHVLRTTDYIEIGKMCFLPDFNDTQCFGSIVISQMVKWLKANTRYLYLYTLADGIMGKCGYVYQASNFQYVGSFTTSVYRDSLTGEKIHPRSARTGAWIYAHNKIHEVEHENVGVEGAHKSELVAERGIRKVSRFAKRRWRTRHARSVVKWEKKEIRASADYAFHTAAQEHPELYSNPLSRFSQKWKLKREYAKRAREAAKQGARAAEKTAVTTEKLARRVALFVKRHPVGVLIVLAVLLVVMLLMGALSSLPGMIGGGAMNAVLGTSYGSEDSDLLGADEDYTALERAMADEIANIESTHPGYDEYRYQVDEVGHNPYELSSYLTAKFQSYTRAEVQGELQAVFDAQYKLTLTETVEIRYRTETDTWTDEEGNSHTDTYEVPYEYYILTVTLKNRTLPVVINERLTADQKELYSATMWTKGNKPYLWDNIYTGGDTDPGPSYEIPGEALTDPDFAALIAEAEKYLGYPYVWGGSSPSTSFDCSGFVCWVYTHSGVYNLPRTTATGIYNQCAIVPKSEARPGELIFFTRTYASAGPVSHVGIYVGDNMMIHCGDPIKYANISMSYWQEHFYAFGRLN